MGNKPPCRPVVGLQLLIVHRSVSSGHPGYVCRRRRLPRSRTRLT